jgi:hypothetical protein
MTFDPITGYLWDAENGEANYEGLTVVGTESWVLYRELILIKQVTGIVVS